jgi:putative phage-type endonuclease
MSTDIELVEGTERIKVSGLSRDEWLAGRKTGIGGSDAGGVMQMSKWSSWLSIYADKKGLTPAKEANEDMDFGNLMEPVIRGWVRGVLKAEGIEARIEKPGFMYRSKKWPWAIANLDGRIYTNDDSGERGRTGILEIKTADRAMKSEWKEGELPDMYFCQVQHCMAVMGDSWARVACLLGKRLIHRIVPRNDQFIVEMMEEERKLWEMIQQGIMPAPSGMDCDDDVLAALYGEVDDSTVVELPPVEVAMFLQEKQNKEDHEKAQKEWGQKLKVRMGNATRGVSEIGTASWSRFERSHFKIDDLRKDMPDVASKYTETKPSERFVVTAKKEAKK